VQIPEPGATGTRLISSLSRSMHWLLRYPSVLAPAIRLISPGVKVIKPWTKRRKNPVLATAGTGMLPTVWNTRFTRFYLFVYPKITGAKWGEIDGRDVRDSLFVGRPLSLLLSPRAESNTGAREEGHNKSE